MKSIPQGSGQMVLAMVISGSIGAFVLFSGLAVIDVVFWRCLIGAAALFVFILFGKQPFTRPALPLLLLAIAGGIALVVNWLLLFAAYRHLSMGLTTVVYNTQPFMLVLMSMLLGERVTWVKWGWLLLAFTGVILLLLSEFNQPNAQWLTGIALALGAAFFYAITALIARHLKALPPQHIALIQVLTGTVMLLPLAHMPVEAADFPWAILLTLGIVHTGMMYHLLYSAIQKLPTPLIGSLSFIYPLVAIALDKWLFDHALSAAQLAGGGLILLAAAGNNLGWGERKRAVANCPSRL